MPNSLLRSTTLNEQRDGLGLQFLAAVDAAIKDIIEWPESWPPHPDWEGEPIIRSRRVKGFPFHVIYLVDGETAVVFAYAHERRKPGYWFSRVDR